MNRDESKSKKPEVSESYTKSKQSSEGAASTLAAVVALNVLVLLLKRVFPLPKNKSRLQDHVH